MSFLLQPFLPLPRFFPLITLSTSSRFPRASHSRYGRCLARRDRPGSAACVDGNTARERGAVHEPDRVLAGRAVAPQNVGLAVSVKVRDSCDAPVEIRHRRDERAAREGYAVHEPDGVLPGRAM